MATCGAGLDNNWQWSSDALSCGALRLDPHEISRLLQGKWVVIAGDSISRYFYAALLRALASGEVQQLELEAILHVVWWWWCSCVLSSHLLLVVNNRSQLLHVCWLCGALEACLHKFVR